MLLRPCPQCGTTNRIPYSRLSQEGRCGACKAPLPPLDMPLEAGPSELDAILAFQERLLVHREARARPDA
ncbi:MAG: hypothetical protein ACPL7M_08915, partial [Bryobacteraceae bacterium]